MEELVIEVDANELTLDNPWPGTSVREQLNMSAVTLLVDNLEDVRNEVYYIFFYIIPEIYQITFRTNERVDSLRHLLRVFVDIPELRIISTTLA